MITYTVSEVQPDGSLGDPWADFREMVACGEDVWSLRAYGPFARVDLDLGAAGRCGWAGALVDLAWALAEWMDTRPSRMRFHPLEQGDVLEVHLLGDIVEVWTETCQVVVAETIWTGAVAAFLARLWSDVCSHDVSPSLTWDWRRRS